MWPAGGNPGRWTPRPIARGDEFSLPAGRCFPWRSALSLAVLSRFSCARADPPDQLDRGEHCRPGLGLADQLAARRDGLLAPVATEARLASLAILSVVTVVLSWALANTVFALKYARLYYEGEADADGGIDFKQPQPPAYSDFA